MTATPIQSWRRSRRTFRAGLIVLAPLVITAWALVWLFGLLDGVLGRSLGHWTHQHIPGLGLGALGLLIGLVGAIVRTGPGRRAILAIDRGLAAWGLTSWIYSPATQLTQVSLGGNRRMFKRTVMIQFPMPGSWTLGFVTTDAPRVIEQAIDVGEMIGVFVPHAPNPTGGFLLFVPVASVREVNLPVEAAFRLVVTGGAIAQHLDTADEDRHPLGDMLDEIDLECRPPV